MGVDSSGSTYWLLDCWDPAKDGGTNYGVVLYREHPPGLAKAVASTSEKGDGTPGTKVGAQDGCCVGQVWAKVCAKCGPRWGTRWLLCGSIEVGQAGLQERVALERNRGGAGEVAVWQ